MRIGILTFHYVMNYGAVVQSYALCRTLRQLGHDAFVIDYRPWRTIKRETRFRSLPLRLPYYYRFIHSFIPLSPRTYWSAKSLGREYPKCDIYVAGSDQVWNPKVHYYFDTSYLLDFVSNDKGKLVSYAASFGGEPIDEEYKPVFTRLINRFTHISVRERESQKLVEELTGRKAQVVLDPTLLLKDFPPDVIRSPSVGAPYIAVYCVEWSEGFLSLIDRIKKVTGLPAISLGYKLTDIDHTVRCIGPSEWLGYLRGATYVCTNSFHGAAISINLQKPFFVYPVSRRFSRIRDLLEFIGLDSQIVQSPDRLDTREISPKCIDYNQVSIILNQRIRDSIQFLNEALLPY